MHLEKLPVSAIHAWVEDNGISFNGVTISQLTGDRGLGVVGDGGNSKGTGPLMLVPADLILSVHNVFIFAKSDQNLREVLEAAGDYSRVPQPVTARGAILIFLLLQLTYNSSSKVERKGASNPFTQYLKFLPSSFTLPTFWNAAERELVAGTSLEPALHAKLKSLDREFATLREVTASIGWCQDHWWSVDTAQGVSIDDWRLVDAMYRSRALDLPGTGNAMVPCIDMANHASGDHTSALYDTDSNGNATLILRKGKCIVPGEEASVTYGDEKGACEMLFSYGFIEDTMETARELFLDLDIPDDDPLKPVKKAVSNSAPGFRLFSQGDSSTSWEGPFVWLLCINEEDGLHFQLSNTIDGERELKIFWDDFEISDVSTFGQILEAHALWDIFRLRMITVLQGRVASQLLSLESSKTRLGDIQRSSHELVGAQVSRYASRLRFLEEALLLRAYQDFDNQKAELLESKTVLEYLGLNNM